MKEQYGRSLRILLAVCALSWLIAQRRESAAGPPGCTPRTNRRTPRDGRSRRRIVREALVESVLLAVAGADRWLTSVAASKLCLLAFSLAFLTIDTMPSPPHCARDRARAAHRHPRSGARMVCDAHQSGGSAARLGANDR
jgi:hypothetical protein